MFTTNLTTDEMISKVADKLDKNIISSYNELDDSEKESNELRHILSNLLEDLEEMDVQQLKKWSNSYKSLIKFLPNFNG